MEAWSFLMRRFYLSLQSAFPSVLPVHSLAQFLMGTLSLGQSQFRLPLLRLSLPLHSVRAPPCSH